MNLKLFFTVFGTIFLAELGDKTQLAVMALTAEHKEGLVWIFLGAALALVLTSLLAVLLGGVITRFVPTHVIHYLAGGGFIVIGILMILGKF
jgi:putative Ca2+/H+ antiporter (TMEM165/GDT1 family)